MEERTPEEELEYRRYLRKRIRMRKRRRKVMIARTIVASVAIILVFFICYGIGWLTGPLTSTKEPKQANDKVAISPTATPLEVDIPEGYETVYQKLYAMREDYEQVDDILISMERYPIDVLELLAKNVETIEFVSDYLKHVDDTEPIGEITQEEILEKYPALKQWDKRWGYVKYGGNILAITGCGPTCMSIVYTGLTGKNDMSPAAMADFCMENNYYTQDSGTSWSFMLNGAQKLGMTSERVVISDSTIQDKLAAGYPVICSMQPGDFTTTGHFIVLRGVTDEGKILVCDPNSIRNSESEWDYALLQKQIKAAWAYSLAQ